ncbi:hypothetical protein PV735_11420 [Streptomyces turgidiscabies]|uniref:Uncharacterized protein n=1 Tax=Streptomyces turgidiscabies (strain Car8) TaxID=698760 RepID=L7ERX4_STRT8|nr:hypothetical protein [Streptomyces turgidiscabies]ELP61782.1 hypothetical protein STRTUCAR8_06462 [Streptomyces turgidiscabies Car8]MDX3493294.1 hypothetical protein [Streptomyces turgidiscabies]GAQ70595.1 hypothetical protein T45_02331 [Streptomyces turgidiscabies]
MAVYPSIPAGRRLTDALLESMLPIFAVKAVTEPITNSTMQNDDELLAAVAANATYDVTLKLLYDCATAADITLGWSGPASATMNWAAIGAQVNVTSSGTVPDMSMQTRLITEVQDLGGGASTGTVAWVTGTLLTAGTAGTLNFRWAQRATNATATNVRAGSSLWLRRTA